MLGNLYLGLTITDFLIICGTFIGALLGTTLLFVSGRNKWSNKLLAVLIWSILLYLIPGFLDRFGLLSEFPHLLGIQRLAGYLIGPLIFFYVKSNLVEGFSLKRHDLLHLLPFAIDLLYNLPFFLQTGTSKLSTYPDELQNISFSIPALIKSIHAFAYLLLSIKQIREYKNHLNNTVSSIDRDYHRLMMAIAGLLLVPLGAILIFALSGFSIEIRMVILWGFFLFLTGLVLIAFIKPQLLHDFPHPMPKDHNAIDKKYQTSSLQEDQKQKYLDRLIRYMEDQQPHLKAELTLKQLASALNILPNHLSQVINEQLNQSFLDFINLHRVTEAKKILSNPRYNHLTVLAIAHDAGFNSKTAFYTAFKRETGTNPSDFRKSLNINK